MAVTKIVGFDPASERNIGWASFIITEKKHGIQKFEACGGTFVIPKVKERWQALWPMFVVVDTFLGDQAPDLVVVEETSSFSGGNRFVRGQVSKCLGLIQAACGKHGVVVGSVYPSSIKKCVTGNGRASKKVVEKCTKKALAELCGEEIEFDSQHAYDAAAAILCWLIKQNSIEIEIDDEIK